MGAIQDALIRALASRIKPQYTPNTQQVVLRGSPDGAQYVQSLVPTKQVLCDEGSYFVTTNPTPSTPIAYGSGGTQTSFSDTVPFLQVINTGNPGDPAAPVVFVDYLKLLQIGGTAPASTTSVNVVARLDNGFRASTAGTPTTNTPVNANMNLATPAPVARVVTYSGAVATIPALSAAGRQVGRALIKGGPTLLLDEYTIAHGMNDSPAGQGYLTTVSAYTSRMPPIGIGPGQSLTYHLFMAAAATNPFSYEFELGHWER